MSGNQIISLEWPTLECLLWAVACCQVFQATTRAVKPQSSQYCARHTGTLHNQHISLCFWVCSGWPCHQHLAGTRFSTQKVPHALLWVVLTIWFVKITWFAKHDDQGQDFNSAFPSMPQTIPPLKDRNNISFDWVSSLTPMTSVAQQHSPWVGGRKRVVLIWLSRTDSLAYVTYDNQLHPHWIDSQLRHHILAMMGCKIG